MFNLLLNTVENYPNEIIVDENSNINTDRLSNVLMISFYEEIISLSRSLITLKDNEISSGREALSRCILENLAYLKLFLETENKDLLSLSYLASEQNSNLKIYNILQDRSNKGENLRGFLKLDNENKLSQFLKKNESIKDFSSYEEVFKYRKQNQKWYNLDGKISNFEKLCERLGLSGYYNTSYRLFSAEVHSNNLSKRILNKSNASGIMSQKEISGLDLAVAEYALSLSTLLILKYFKEENKLKTVQKLYQND